MEVVNQQVQYLLLVLQYFSACYPQFQTLESSLFVVKAITKYEVIFHEALNFSQFLFMVILSDATDNVFTQEGNQSI